MKIEPPKTIRTDEAIFKVVTYDDDIFFCNLDFAHSVLPDCKKLYRIWNFKFEVMPKIHLVTMFKNR